MKVTFSCSCTKKGNTWLSMIRCLFSQRCPARAWCHQNCRPRFRFSIFKKKLFAEYTQRSYLSLRPLFLSCGVIDSYYRGNISVFLTNFDSSTVEIKVGDRIAQIMFFRKEQVTFEEVDVFNDSTVRRVNGFGSTD